MTTPLRRMQHALLVAALASMLGCTGKIGDPPAVPACASSASRRVRRLSQREYFNVVTDLLGRNIAALGAGMLPLEPTVAGFDNQDTALLASSAFQEALANVAEKLSAAVDAAKIAPCPTPAGSPDCLSAFARPFARKAYGRAPTADEVARLLSAASAGDSYAISVQLVVETVLQSPSMLYASELGPDAPSGSPSVTLTASELASQLSLLLTGARPDDELLRAAEEGRLATPASLESTVKRLIESPRGAEQLRLFVKGWMDLGPVADAPKSADVFPAFTPAVAAAMQDEIDTFIDANVKAGRGTLALLMSSTSAHVPAELAPIYGDELRTVNGASAPDPQRRRGILSLPGVLTYHSADQHSGPIERGLLVRRQLFCQDVPPPPASVLQRLAQNPIDPTDKAKTTRQKYEQHKTEAFCAACHKQFDVIGFGMEEMDGLGRFRTVENGLPVDSSGELASTDVDGSFVGIAQLSQKIAPSDMFAGCFVRQFFRFAQARVPEPTEQCVVDDWTRSFLKGGGALGDLFIGYVTRPEFAVRKEDR